MLGHDRLSLLNGYNKTSGCKKEEPGFVFYGVSKVVPMTNSPSVEDQLEDHGGTIGSDRHYPQRRPEVAVVLGAAGDDDHRDVFDEDDGVDDDLSNERLLLNVDRQVRRDDVVSS